MKILHYTGVYAPAWKWGGPPRSSANLAEGLARIGHSVTVFTTNAGLEDVSSIPTDRPVFRNGVEVFYFPCGANLMGLKSPALEAAVRSRVNEFSVLHVTGVWQPTSVAACRAAEAAMVPYVVSPRGALSPYSFSQKRLKKWIYWLLMERRSCDRAALVHYTASLEKRECDRLGLRGRAVVIPNAIDLSEWYRDEKAGQKWRRDLGGNQKAPVLLYVGRLHHKKGLDLICPAMSFLRDKAWRLVLIGDDEDGSGEKLKRELALAGFADRSIFLSATDSTGLRAAYSGSDLLMMPSRHENFGNVAVEAMACGCSVLLSDAVGAADDLLPFGGARVAPRCPRVWAEQVAVSLTTREHPDTAEVRRAFSADTLAIRMALAYQGLVS